MRLFSPYWQVAACGGFSIQLVVQGPRRQLTTLIYSAADQGHQVALSV